MSNADFFSIKIEGDFIDSFIYSGTLFLVRADSRVTTHGWESLLDFAVADSWGGDIDQTAVAFLKDCRRKFSSEQLSKTIHIDSETLLKNQNSDVQLKGWPTDINVYSNRFYVADEAGVDELKFNHLTRTIDSNERFSIYDQYAYKISPNDGHRIAIAAGVNGVLAAFPRTGYIKPAEDIHCLVDVDAHDCEWIGENLAANSLDGAYLFEFSELPSRPLGPIPDGYWEKYNIARKTFPKLLKISGEHDYSDPYAWVAGARVYMLNGTGNMSMGKLSDGEVEWNNDNFNVFASVPNKINSADYVEERVVAARTGLFGTVVEKGNSLYSITENGIDKVSHRPVSWRVFPRAKSYLNQLHVIENDFLIIRAYATKEGLASADRYGIGFDEVV